MKVNLFTATGIQMLSGELILESGVMIMDDGEITHILHEKQFDRSVKASEPSQEPEQKKKVTTKKI